MTARQLVTRPHPDDRIDPAKRGPQTMRQVTVNIAESPIAWLAARGHLTQAQLGAGERLRADYERAGLAARVTMRWDAAPPAKSRGGARGGCVAGPDRRAPELSRGARCGGAGAGRHLLAGDLCGGGDCRGGEGAGVAGAVGETGTGSGAGSAGAVLWGGVAGGERPASTGVAVRL